jgi:acyl dehydratase
MSISRRRQRMSSMGMVRTTRGDHSIPASGHLANAPRLHEAGNIKEATMRFADLTPGVVIRTPPRIVSSKEIIEFASRFDPQWIHVDPKRARQGRWKGLIASGWHTCSIAMELMVRSVLLESESFGSPGIDSIKWLEPVRPDDAVALRFEVLRSSKSPSGRTGILLSKSELWNQNERLVLSLQGTTLFDVTAESPAKGQ